MSLEKLYQASKGGELSSEECEEINMALASVKYTDIPSSQHDNVRDYLVSALNINSVSHELVGKLDALLNELQ
jgi:hypothetical protein